MNLSRNKSLLLLHLIIIIWGFTGILGKLISSTSEIIVLYRMAVAFLVLIIFCKFYYKKIRTKINDLFKYFGIGLITAIHWVCFFESIKLSNVSLALVCLSTISLFTAILDPIFDKRRVSLFEVFLSIIVVFGIMIIFKFESFYYKAIILSIISAFFGAIFTILNHKLINNNHKSMIMTTWQMLGGSVFLLVYIFLKDASQLIEMPEINDFIYIIILGVFCTALAFSLSIEIMKKISPFTVNLSVNLEPIYSIILALIIFGESEIMTKGFYIGSIVIMISVFTNIIVKRKSLK